MKATKQLLITTALLLGFIATSHATVTTFGLWNLGEDDLGASAGNVANNPTMDFSANNLDLIRVGAPLYSSATPGPVSTLSMNFASAASQGFHYGSVISTVTDNFGVEAWVRSTTTSGNAAVAYNGTPGSDGWGLYRIGADWSALMGGVSQVVKSPVAVNTWTHIAMVRDSGTTRLYVNGVAVITSTGLTPNIPAGDFGLGFRGTEFFNGDIDQARVFTFTGGEFVPADLLYSVVPEPATASILIMGAISLLSFRRRNCRPA